MTALTYLIAALLILPPIYYGSKGLIQFLIDLDKVNNGKSDS